LAENKSPYFLTLLTGVGG